MRPKRNVVSKYQRNQKENDVQSVTYTTKNIADPKQIPQTRPRRALADKTNSVSVDKITSVCNNSVQNKKPSIMDSSERPKRQAKLPPRLRDKSMEIPSRFRNVGKPANSSTPSKLKPKVTELDKKFSQAADSNNNPDSISILTKISEQKLIDSVKANIERAPVQTTPTISMKEILPIVETKSIHANCMDTSSKQVDKDDNVDVYEFDFDPSEEPVIKKKKKPIRRRKRIVKEKLASAFFVKENYNKKMDKKLEELKKIIASKTISKVPVSQASIPSVAPIKISRSQTKSPVVLSDVHNKEHLVTENLQFCPPSPEIMQDFQINDSNALHAAESATATVSGHDLIKTGNQEVTKTTNTVIHANPIVTFSNTSNRSDLSFLEEMPVACSSFNVSQVKKRTSGSPWRANFEIEPKKWPVNFYLKPGSLTPAYESTFHCVDLISDKSKVYAPLPTNNTDQATLLTPEKDYSQLKQSSILSFFEEVVKKSASKKVRKSKLTPQKFDLFYDASESSNRDLGLKRKAVVKSIFTTPTKLSMTSESTSPKKQFETLSNLDAATLSESPQEETSAPNEYPSLSISHKKTPAKPSPNKNYGKENKENNKTGFEKRNKELQEKCFGFDDSDEDYDQENVSPQAINVNRKRGGAFNIGMRKREALKEVNIQHGPMRVNVPLKPKLVHPENIPEKIVHLMSQLDAAKAQKKHSKPTGINDSSSDSSEVQMKEPEPQPSTSQKEDLPLFTDIDFVHYNKPERRSYGKPKAATAKRVRSTSGDHEHGGSDLDLSSELNFNETKRKPTKKRKANALSKKEVKEADEWVAGFNSMVEEVDDFHLVVE